MTNTDFKECTKCKYWEIPPDKEPCIRCKYNATDLYRPMTNADGIRKMSDEELAEWLYTNTSSAWRGREQWLEWLQEERE